MKHQYLFFTCLLCVSLTACNKKEEPLDTIPNPQTSSSTMSNESGANPSGSANDLSSRNSNSVSGSITSGRSDVNSTIGINR